MANEGYRVERDSMGELRVPEQALWGAQTQRAIDNFPLSGLPMPRGFIRALGLIKWAAAGVNTELGLLKNRKSLAIQSAALIDRLVALEDRPWAEWGRGQKPMSMVQLSRQLSSFEIYPTSFRFGAHVHKGYRLDLFTDAFERYLPPPVPPDIPSVTRLQTEHFPGKSDISSVTPKNTVTDRTVTANPRVTDQNPGENGGEQDSELF